MRCNPLAAPTGLAPVAVGGLFGGLYRVAVCSSPEVGRLKALGWVREKNIDDNGQLLILIGFCKTYILIHSVLYKYFAALTTVFSSICGK